MTIDLFGCNDVRSVSFCGSARRHSCTRTSSRKFIDSETQAASWEEKSMDFCEQTDSANNFRLATIQIDTKPRTHSYSRKHESFCTYSHNHALSQTCTRINVVKFKPFLRASDCRCRLYFVETWQGNAELWQKILAFLLCEFELWLRESGLSYLREQFVSDACFGRVE